MVFRHSSLIFLFLVVTLAVTPLFLGRIYATGDMYDVFIPLEKFFQTQLRAGHVPLWHPDLGWGHPVIASAQIGFFYPPLLILRLLPLPLYFALALISHLIWLGAGTYYFARRLNITTEGALLSAISMTLSAFMFQHVTHFNVVVTLAWFPWQMVAMQRYAKQPTKTTFVYSALVLAIPFLAGHLHMPFLMAATSSLYYLWLSRTRMPRALGRTFLLGTIVVALAAIQLFPTLELVKYSSRNGEGEFGLDRANQLSWPVYHAPTLLWPRFFGTDSDYWGKRLEVEYGIFIGTLPLLIVVLTLRPLWRTHRWLIVTASLGFLLALGDMSPFRLIGFEPSLWYFSAPARWLFVYTFAMSLLSGAGLDILRTNPSYLRRAAFLTLGTLSILVMLYNLAIWYSPINTPERLTHFLDQHQRLGERPLLYYEEKIRTLMQSLQHTGVSFTSWYTWLPLLALGGAALATRHRAFPSLLISITAVELIIIAATTNPTLPWSKILTPPATINELSADVQSKQARILTLAKSGDSGLWLTNPHTRPDTAEREQRRQLLITASNALYNIAGTQWPASLDLQSHFETLEPLTHEGSGITDPNRAEELNIGTIILDPSVPYEVPPTTNVKKIDNATLLILNPVPRVALVTDSSTTPLPYNTSHPTHLTWTTNTTSPAQLIVRDTDYPGWHAEIDGQPTTITTHEKIFRLVTVPAGQHTVTMTYRPKSFVWGATLSALALLVLLIIRQLDRPYHRFLAGH